jgi:hypothetical protein
LRYDKAAAKRRGTTFWDDINVKRFLASLAIATAFCATAHANTVQLDVPAGFFGGSAHDFTFGETWSNYGSSPWAFMNFYEDRVNTLVYEKGVFDFSGMNLNARPWDGWGDHGQAGAPAHQLMFAFKDLAGNVIASGQVALAESNDFQHIAQSVQGVHSIEFLTAAPEQFFPRLQSIDLTPFNPVPEAQTYAMLLAGLALLATRGKRRQ